MNRNLLLAFLSALLLLSGCVINGGGHHQPQPADVTFSWTFVGKTCADFPDVQTVQIQIPGESLDNNGAYPCLSNGYPGIVLHEFVPGSYNYTVTAYGSRNNVLFTQSGTFSINGTNVIESVDLTPVNQPNSWAYLLWTFPAQSGVTRPCYDRGIAYVDVQVDSAPLKRFNCDDGIADPGVVTDLLNPGQHTVSAWAKGTDEYTYYGASTTIVTATGKPAQNSITLNWVVGGASAKWALYNGSTAISCQNAGVDTMYATFQDVNNPNNILYGVLNDYTTWDKVNNFCTQYSYLHWDYLPYGTYKVYLRAIGTGGVTYDSNFQNPPQVTVVAGTVVPEAQAQVVNMSRIQ